jgi:CRISPR/Cas system-associated exonuclease Cas4 (RecB family)
VETDAGPAPRETRLRATPSPLPLRISVTSLAEYARCPRRHWFTTWMRIPEPRRDEHGGDDPDRATVRGTLAHALLSEVDLLAPPLERRALLAAAASRRGEDPDRPGVRRIVEDVDRFLASSGGERLAGAAREGALRRELPFLLRLDGEPAFYLDGALDALIVNKDLVEVLDFKYAPYHPGAEERYRLQLAAYALAASRAFGERPVRATLHFLRMAQRTVDVTPSGEALRRLAEEIPSLALGAFRGDGRDLSPVDVGRDEARCRAEGCGFATRCFGPPGARAA